MAAPAGMDASKAASVAPLDAADAKQSRGTSFRCRPNTSQCVSVLLILAVSKDMMLWLQLCSRHRQLHAALDGNPVKCVKVLLLFLSARFCRTELLRFARWPLSGIPGLQSRVGRDSGGFLGGDGSGGVPCAAGCERLGNCNRDSGACE